MFGKFVGIDFNNGKVVICEVDRSFFGHEIGMKESVSSQLRTADSPDGEKNITSSLLSGFDLADHNVCAAITKQAISVNILRFPFKDSGKVKQAYKFELGNETLYDPDEKLNSYHLAKRKTFSEALVAMFERSDMESFIDHMKSYGLDPSFVTYAPFAFSSLNKHLSNERPLLLVDVNSSDMNFILFDEEGIRRVRSANEALSEFTSGLGVENKDGFTFSGVCGEKIEKEKFDPLIKEVARTMHFFEKELREDIRSVVLTGEMCLLEDIEEVFTESLDKQVSRIFIEDLGEENSPIFAKSYAIALYGAYANQDSMNLRIDEFKFKNRGLDIKNIKKNFLFPALLLAAFLTLTFYRGISETMSSGKDVKTLRTELQREVKKVFPNVASAIPDPVSFIQAEVLKMRDKISLIEEVKGGSTPLDVIRIITSIFSSDLDIRVDEVRFESGKQIKIWGRCSSYKDIAKVEKILSESEKFAEVKREQVSQSTDNSVKFIMSMVVN